MDDLISRQAAIDACIRFREYRAYDEIEEIKALPPAQTELILCKDCKHYDGRPCGKVDWYNSADDYCSRGERKPDEE